MTAYPDIRFIQSAHKAGDFPADKGREVAFAGRSNAGKSSARFKDGVLELKVPKKEKAKRRSIKVE